MATVPHRAKQCHGPSGARTNRMGTHNDHHFLWRRPSKKPQSCVCSEIADRGSERMWNVTGGSLRPSKASRVTCDVALLWVAGHRGEPCNLALARAVAPPRVSLAMPSHIPAMVITVLSGIPWTDWTEPSRLTPPIGILRAFADGTKKINTAMCIAKRLGSPKA